MLTFRLYFFWKEARLCLVHEQGRVEPIFGAAMGTVDEAGDQLANCAIRAGCGSNTKLHFVGDGAKWIKQRGCLESRPPIL